MNMGNHGDMHASFFYIPWIYMFDIYMIQKYIMSNTMSSQIWKSKKAQRQNLGLHFI